MAALKCTSRTIRVDGLAMTRTTVQSCCANLAEATCIAEAHLSDTDTVGHFEPLPQIV